MSHGPFPKGKAAPKRARGGGEGQKSSSSPSAPSEGRATSPLFGDSRAQREAFRAYLRAIQAFGEASEVLYLAETSTTAYREGAGQLGASRGYPSAQEVAEEEWRAAFRLVTETQTLWQVAAGLACEA